METIEIRTLIDITNTGARRANQGSAKEVDQYKNWTTLNQCLGIRSNIEYDEIPSVETVDVKDQGFGSSFKGKQKMWVWRFRPDRTGAYSDDIDRIGTLVTDLDKVPIIKNLDETVNISKAVFDLTDETARNTIVRLVKGNT
jgi:hypothetical protein